MEDFENLKYKDLQKLAKAAGIKANSPKAELVKALIELQASSNVENNENKDVDVGQSPELLADDIDVETQNKLNETYEKENSTLNVTFDKEDTDLDDSQRTEDQSADGSNSRFIEFMDKDVDEVSFRRSSRRSIERNRSSTPISAVKTKRASIANKTPSRDYLSKKNKTPLRQVVKTPGSIKKKSESNIPRFMKFASKGSSSVRKVPNFAKIHAKNSVKMESLDDYLDKKKKLTDTVKKQLDNARALAEEHSSIVKKVKSSLADSKFVPKVTCVAKMNLNFGNMRKSKDGVEPFKFNSKPVAAAPKAAPKERKDLKASTKTKAGQNKKPKRTSLDSPKPLLNITNTNKSLNMTNKSMNMTDKSLNNGKKFDLKASLAKPLSYQPHKGKIKPLEKKKKEVVAKIGSSSQEETKKRQTEVIKGVRLNKRAELLMMRRKISN